MAWGSHITEQDKSYWSTMSFPSGKGKLNFIKSQTVNWIFVPCKVAWFAQWWEEAIWMLQNDRNKERNRNIIHNHTNTLTHTGAHTQLEQPMHQTCLPSCFMSGSRVAFNITYTHTPSSVPHLLHYSIIFIKKLQIRSWTHLIILQPSCINHPPCCRGKFQKMFHCGSGSVV